MSRRVLSFLHITVDFQVENIPSVETSQLLLGAITANGKIVKVKDDKDKDKDKDNTIEDGGTATEEKMNKKTEEKDEKKNTKNCEGENKEKDQDQETSNQLLISHAAAVEAKKMIARWHCTLQCTVHCTLKTVHCTL